MPFAIEDWTPAATIGGGSENVWRDGSGLHVTQTKEGEPVSGGNLLAASDGLHVRDGDVDMLKATGDGVTVGRDGGGRVRTVGDGVEFYIPGIDGKAAALRYDDRLGVLYLEGFKVGVSGTGYSSLNADHEAGGIVSGSSVTSNARSPVGGTEPFGDASIAMKAFTGQGHVFNEHSLVLDASRGLSLDGDRIAAFPCEVVDSGMWGGYKLSDGNALIWGRKGFDMSSTGEWGALYYGDVPAVDYPFAFAGQPYELTDILGSKYYWLVSNAECTKTRTGTYYNVSPSRHATASRCWVTYIVCGRWK